VPTTRRELALRRREQSGRPALAVRQFAVQRGPRSGRRRRRAASWTDQLGRERDPPFAQTSMQRLRVPAARPASAPASAGRPRSCRAVDAVQQVHAEARRLLQGGQGRGLASVGSTNGAATGGFPRGCERRLRLYAPGRADAPRRRARAKTEPRPSPAGRRAQQLRRAGRSPRRRAVVIACGEGGEASQCGGSTGPRRPPRRSLRAAAPAAPRSFASTSVTNADASAAAHGTSTPCAASSRSARADGTRSRSRRPPARQARPARAPCRPG